MKVKIHIYALIDPYTENVFYVGATKNKKIQVRLSRHCSLNYKKPDYSYVGSERWKKQILIEDIMYRGEKPIIKLLKSVSLAEAKYWEEYFYRLFVFYGFELYQTPSYFYQNRRVKLLNLLESNI